MSVHARPLSGHMAEVGIETGGVTLPGSLMVPAGATGVVAFAHGSGSSRFSPRNLGVSALLNAAGLGTLLFDLLTARESRIDDVTRELRFDIPLLSARLTGAVDWLHTSSTTARLPIGLFGASTGAAAALRAAAARSQIVAAVVSRGGRPDLADDALPAVRAPTLLIVGGDDEPVIGMNRDAAAHLQCEWRLDIIPGATHLFEEPGTMDKVAQLTREWFLHYLGKHERR